MKRIILAFALLALTACSHGYKKLGSNHQIGGYDEAPLGAGKYRLTYQGQGDNTPPKVYSFFLLRAAELAKQDGYPYFKVESGQPGEMVRGMVGATASIPNYSGTVVLLKDKAPDSHDAEEIIKRTPRQ